MSSYSINMDSFMAPQDTNKLYDMLSIVNEGDELILRVPYDNAQGIISMLDKNSFSFTTQGDHNDGKYIIIAKRREEK